MIPTTGASATRRAPYFARDFFRSSARDGARRLAQLRVLVVVVGDPVEDLQRRGLRGSVPEAHDRQPPHRDVRIPRCEIMEQRAERVDVARMTARETFERDERRPASRRAVVLEPAAQELELLPEAELRDRAIGLRADAVVRVAGARLDLLVPLRPELRERALVAGLGEGVRLGSRLRERHAGWSERGAGPT